MRSPDVDQYMFWQLAIDASKHKEFVLSCFICFPEQPLSAWMKVWCPQMETWQGCQKTFFPPITTDHLFKHATWLKLSNWNVGIRWDTYCFIWNDLYLEQWGWIQTEVHKRMLFFSAFLASNYQLKITTGVGRLYQLAYQLSSQLKKMNVQLVMVKCGCSSHEWAISLHILILQTNVISLFCLSWINSSYTVRNNGSVTLQTTPPPQ